MRQRQYKVSSVMSVMTVLWSLSLGCPNAPGPTCHEELPNAIATINRLKKSLKDLLKTFADEGYRVNPPRRPVCILINNGITEQPTDLDTTDNRLCQYSRCFQHFAFNINEISHLPFSITNEIAYCQNYLNNLENTIKKMKRQPPASCVPPCEVSWSFTARTWDKITTGRHLAQELLTYLEQLRFPCS